MLVRLEIGGVYWLRRDPAIRGSVPVTIRRLIPLGHTSGLGWAEVGHVGHESTWTVGQDRLYPMTQEELAAHQLTPSAL
jgi:hypothetical protein